MARPAACQLPALPWHEGRLTWESQQVNDPIGEVQFALAKMGLRQGDSIGMQAVDHLTRQLGLQPIGKERLEVATSEARRLAPQD